LLLDDPREWRDLFMKPRCEHHARECDTGRFGV
jgi:hypothetical protein